MEVLFITSIEARTDDFQVLDDTARLGTTAELGKDKRREERGSEVSTSVDFVEDWNGDFDLVNSIFVCVVCANTTTKECKQIEREEEGNDHCRNERGERKAEKVRRKKNLD